MFTKREIKYFKEKLQAQHWDDILTDEVNKAYNNITIQAAINETCPLRTARGQQHEKGTTGTLHAQN